MKDSQLSVWLYQNRCFLTKDSNTNITHICLDGGRLNIPDYLISDFIKVYSDGISKGDKYYICENINSSDTIRMYCDFDFITDEEITIDQVKEFSLILNENIAKFFGSYYVFTVCKATSKSIQKNKKKQIKSGFHIIWKELFVSPSIAMDLAFQFQNSLSGLYSGFDWKNIIDTQVYNNGLRMVGSRKVVNKKRRIKNVSNASESSVPMDYEVIKVDENRSYRPIFLVNHKNEITDYDIETDFNYLGQTEIYNFVKDTIIRTSNNEKQNEPVVDIPEAEKPKKVRSDPKTDTDINDPKVVERVENFIRYQTITQWNSPLRQLKKHKNFYIAKIDSMYCLNMQREHNSCGIYFQITDNGMYQRCFCRCDTTEGRLNGLCSQYKSQAFQLPKEVQKMLFPDKKPKKNNVMKNTPSKEIFASNLLMKRKETLPLYLSMSFNTIMAIESKCR